MIQRNREGLFLTERNGVLMQISMRMGTLMQNKIEKADFDRIMSDHKLWLADKTKGKRADLSGLDLSEMDLSGMDFSYADMTDVNLFKSDLTHANLSYADLNQAHLHDADLSNATIEETNFSNADITMAKLNGCKGKKTHFLFACMWDCEIKDAELPNSAFLYAEVCNCDFSGSNLERASFVCADFDDAIFKNTNLKNTDLCFASRVFWSDFTNADMTGAKTSGVNFALERLNGVKGLKVPLYCPEDGAFVAWKKCREGKIVKLLIPETAERKGSSLHSCRASEAIVLEIFDRDGEPVEEATSIIDKEFKYFKGEKVMPNKVDRNRLGDAEGIYFVLSREETRFYEENDDEDDEEEDIENEEV